MIYAFPNIQIVDKRLVHHDRDSIDPDSTSIVPFGIPLVVGNIAGRFVNWDPIVHS